MNDDFIRQALSHGDEGKTWLENIPKLIKHYEKKWSLKVLQPFTLSYNYVAPVIRKDGTDAVIKIGFPKDKEFQTEIRALALFNGEGAEKLLDVEREQAVILIERVQPGTPLSALENDDEATRILARVMKKLWKPLPTDHSFITIREWTQAISLYQEKYKNADEPLPKNLVDKAALLFDELIQTSDVPFLVHGDLHHDNVLTSDRAGWLAIDPKGIAAEPAYETAAMIRNPYGKMKDYPDLPIILRRRIHILSDELGFDQERILKWCFAQTVLSAVWNDENPKGSEHTIKIAMALDALEL